MIKITKQLQRVDGGTVTANSILCYKAVLTPETKTIQYILSLFFSQAKKDEGCPQLSVTDFANGLSKVCSGADWDLLNDAGGLDQIETWLLEEIIAIIGVGNAVIL